MQLLNQKLIFVSGKGGVGKTSVSKAIALSRARQQKRTLWIEFENPTHPNSDIEAISPYLSHLNCDATRAFEEYITLKIGLSAITKIFVQNKLISYLAKAGPGIHELVLLGKVWHLRGDYDHIVVDMPATGHGLAMFQSIDNWSKLFNSGPLHRDAENMLETFHSPEWTRHLIVALPEEMPLRESLDLSGFLLRLFPKNPAAFLVNRLFPRVSETATNLPGTPDNWPTPVAASEMDYAVKRSVLESYNMRIWRDLGIQSLELDFIAPPPRDSFSFIVEKLADQIGNKGFL